MGISFKISKIGKRYHPKSNFKPEEDDQSKEGYEESSHVLHGAGLDREIEITNAANGTNNLFPEHEVSFILNLYLNGYSIGKPSEIENCQTQLQDVKPLHPYDRASETLFSAVESGWLPSDILDDIPCNYYHGTVVCEVRDYRKCFSEQGSTASTANATPIVQKVQLRMSLENVIKDISLIADDSWTYSDLMEVEARVVKALNSHLYLNPTPKLERLWKGPTVTKLNFGIGRKKRPLHTSEVTISSDNQNPEKKICTDRISESSHCGSGETGSQVRHASLQQAYETMPLQHLSSGVRSMRSNKFGMKLTLPLPSQAKLQTVVNSPTSSQDHGPGHPSSISGINANISSSQNLMGSHPDKVSNSPRSMKRENLDSQLIPFIGIKRQKQTPTGVDGIQQQWQQKGSQLVGLTGTDLQWKNQMLHSHVDAKGGQYASTLGNQRYPTTVVNSTRKQDPGASFHFNHQGMRFGPKEEQLDRQEQDRCKEVLQALPVNSPVDQQQSRAHLLQQPYIRNHPPTPVQWQNARPVSEKDMLKDDTYQKRKSVPSPRVSSGPMVQSPVSSRSGEISSGSAGGQFSGIVTASALGVQKDKLIANSNAAIGAPSVTSSPSDSLNRQQHTSGTAKSKPNSMTKTQNVSAVGSPASVSNMNPSLIVNSPSIGTAPLGDQVIIERFMKIDAITQRYQFNLKKNKVDDYPEKGPTQHSTQELAIWLSDSFNGEDFTDQRKPLSKSLIGGTINTCKDRTISFMRNEPVHQVSMRLIMTEKPFDGTVSMQYEYMDDSKIQDYQLTLPTTNHADLLAAQFAQLMEHDGFQKAEDKIQPIPIHMVAPPGNLSSGLPMMVDTSTSEMKPPEIASGQPSQAPFPAVANAIGPMNSSQHPSSNARMMAAANYSQTLAITQGYLTGASMSARLQQVDQSTLKSHQQQPQQQQQMQQNTSQLQQQQLPSTQLQRSSTLLSANPLSQMIGQNSNLQIGTNQMVNNKPLQLHILQQQKQQQQLPRKMMVELNPAMSMGNMGNNVMGLGNLNNVIGMGGMRAISSPIGTMSGMGNLSPRQMNLLSASNFSAGIPQNSLTHAQFAAMASKFRMAPQNRAGLYSQSGIAGMGGSTNQVLPSSSGLSMLSALHRANMNPLQRNAMSSMGPPKGAGANFYLNPQQQQQLQLQLLQQQPQQQQQQQQIQQQISSPLQQAQVGSPPLVVSPSAMLMQHQQLSPQQMGQQTALSPQQLSSGALQQINNSANPEAGPASPQLSSQTHGSVGSITSSPMEQLQGANKAGSASNV
ncbi:protein PHYTOCHROME-DEPENDENT LATE-FLOWERING-like [Zingiber officinale]|uniref:protein PHYTOCHROME-DEPENDENT LATE-FLOWERING-like n=1 Tax=Zingiber officinale TaxID=94328 RepID=UPI001C4D2E49|nr:protein PHYTOCHROME-DEPENDENT LATE-FLOWERING-like [Zingiber officinale]